MKPLADFEFPSDRRGFLRRAVRLEAITIAYLLSVLVLFGLVYDGTQIIKAELVEVGLSLTAPIAFLVAQPFRERSPSVQFPYGFHRVVSIAFLVASVGLVALGAFLFLDSGLSLIQVHRPTIGSIEVFGRVIWRGWLFLPILVWSVVPAVFLGRAKAEPSRRLHDKVLYADAEMNRADWKTGLTAILGILGIALGFWWADSLAALLISFNILLDGGKNLRACVFDLMDRVPHRVDDAAVEALPARIATELKKLDWVRDARVRLREAGHVFLGEAFVAPVHHRDLMPRVAEARDRLLRLDWRLHEVVIQLEEGATDEAGSS
ncbi:cation transporter [Tautonia sp. JC769]|uniref:cation transporter n=1 Tax=Tautonia sp. JC769 TaxID=3232135 RepID=UPI00345ADE38